MVWTQVAVFDTEESIAEFEEVENFHGSWSSNMRCVNILEESGYFIEEETDDSGVSGWGRVAIIESEYGQPHEIVEGYGGIEDEEYRVIFNYNTERYEIERFYHD